MSGTRKGKQGVPTSGLVRRSQLRRKPKPAGQCRACYAAGLPYSQSRRLCQDCQGR